MLHRVELPDCHEQLARVLRFQQRVIEFACTLPVDLTQAGLANALGQDAGAWFWQRLYYQGRQTRLREHLLALTTHIEQHPQAGPRILEAFQNDGDFVAHLLNSDGNYRFSQPFLPRADLEAIRPFLVDFYETLFRSPGFPETVYGGAEAGKLTRDDWNERFWLNNAALGVCPACDDQRPPRIRGKISSQVNHFFPKETYPFFSIHPNNLIPVCASCNTVAQGARDPIDDHNDAPLLNSFHPYHRPASEHIRVAGHTSPVGKFEVRISENDGTVSRRTQNLVRLLDLEERWADRMEGLVNQLIETLAPRTERELGQLVEEKSEQFAGTVQRESCAYVYHNLLEFIRADQMSLNALWSVFELR